MFAPGRFLQSRQDPSLDHAHRPAAVAEVEVSTPAALEPVEFADGFGNGFPECPVVEDFPDPFARAQPAVSGGFDVGIPTPFRS